MLPVHAKNRAGMSVSSLEIKITMRRAGTGSNPLMMEISIPRAHGTGQNANSSRKLEGGLSMSCLGLCPCPCRKGQQKLSTLAQMWKQTEREERERRNRDEGPWRGRCAYIQKEKPRWGSLEVLVNGLRLSGAIQVRVALG